MDRLRLDVSLPTRSLFHGRSRSVPVGFSTNDKPKREVSSERQDPSSASLNVLTEESTTNESGSFLKFFGWTNGTTHRIPCINPPFFFSWFPSVHRDRRGSPSFHSSFESWVVTRGVNERLEVEVKGLTSGPFFILVRPLFG